MHRIEDTGDAVVISASCTASLGSARPAGWCPRACMAGTRGPWPTARPEAARS